MTTTWNPSDPEARAARRARVAASPEKVAAAKARIDADRLDAAYAHADGYRIGPALRRAGCDVAFDGDYEVTVEPVTGATRIWAWRDGHRVEFGIFRTRRNGRLVRQLREVSS